MTTSAMTGNATVHRKPRGAPVPPPEFHMGERDGVSEPFVVYPFVITGRDPDTGNILGEPQDRPATPADRAKWPELWAAFTETEEYKAYFQAQVAAIT